MKTSYLAIILTQLLLSSCQNLISDELGLNTNLSQKEIQIQNRCFFPVEILIKMNTFQDSLVLLGSLSDTNIHVDLFADSLRIRKQYGQIINFSLEGTSEYSPLVITPEKLP